MRCRLRVALVGAVALLTGSAVAQDKPYFDPKGPFQPGEGFGVPVTCETIGNWIDRVPDFDGRISMVVTGKLVSSQWDGALAYLIMCEPEAIQVMCVTYQPADVTGKPVMMAGGYIRVSERQVMLDPCLLYPVD